MYMLGGPTTIYSDCQSLVSNWALAKPLTLSHKRAAHRHCAPGRMGDSRLVEEAVKVCAHQELDEDLTSREFLRLHNWHADCLANGGRESRPSPIPAENETTWRRIIIARAVAEQAVKVLP